MQLTLIDSVSMEGLAMFISTLPSYSENFEKRFLSPTNRRRFYAALATPIWIMMIIANMYFLMGFDNANHLTEVTLTTWPAGFVVLLCWYCGVQTCFEIRRFQQRDIKVD